MTITLNAVPEPKLHVTSQMSQDWLKECVDEKGHSLMSDSPQNYYYNSGSQWIWQLQGALKEVPDMGMKIARLRGELKFIVATKTETIAVDDLSKLDNITRNLDGNAVTLQKFTAQNGQYQLQASIVGPTAAPGAPYVVQNLISTLSVLTADDESIPQGGWGTSSTQGGQLEVSINYRPMVVRGPRNAGAVNQVPQKLRWVVAKDTKLVTVPFELNDLELPHAP
jgi:hypothetical protein